MGDRLLVHIPGSPEDFQTAADYLRDLADSADGLSDDVIAERGAMESAFQGEGGDAFRERATTLARGGDKLVKGARQAARAIENLGSNLGLVQLQLAVIRVLAADAGLRVTSTHVLAPAPHADADLVLSWNSAVEQQRDHVKRWTDSVEDGAAYLEQVIPYLDGATDGFLIDHYEPWRLGTLSPTLSARALDHFADSQRYTDALRDFVEDIDDGDAEDPGDDPLEWYNQVLQRVRDSDVDKATDLAGRYLNIVDLFSAGADILKGGQEGQDTADVVFREGAGLFYGAVISGATGALAGSPGGPIGTVVGFLVGAVAGAVFQEKFEEAYDANTVTVRESDAPTPGDVLLFGNWAGALVQANPNPGRGAGKGGQVMDFDRMLRTQGILMTAGEELDALGAGSPSGDYGQASSIVLPLLALLEETSAKVAGESELVGVAIGACIGDGESSDREVATVLEVLSLTTYDA